MKEVHKIVTGIRSDATKGEKYMTLHDMIEYEKEESYDEGIEIGIMQSVVIYIDSLREFHVQKEDILDSVIRKFDISKEKTMERMACNL